MLFSVLHRTQYRYSAPIRLGAHVLRLAPRSDAGQLLSHDLRVRPAPVQREDRFDGFGNSVVILEFSGETTEFVVESRFVVDTGVPVAKTQGADVAAYLPQTAIARDVQAYAKELSCGVDLEGFLARLNRDLYAQTDRRIRLDGDAQSASETLRTRTGACRDLTVLFIEACRRCGLPARFISGYQARAESVDGNRHLHAWPEVFLPGVGWRGYDPTHGMPVTDGHVAICAAPDQAGTMPIAGGFWGGPVTSTLSYSIEIEVEEGAP